MVSVGIDSFLDVDHSNIVITAVDRAALIPMGTGVLTRISIGTAGPFAPEGGGGSAPATAGGGDAGISSGLAATSGGSSSSPTTSALPASVATRLDSAGSEVSVLNHNDEPSDVTVSDDDRGGNPASRLGDFGISSALAMLSDLRGSAVYLEDGSAIVPYHDTSSTVVLSDVSQRTSIRYAPGDTTAAIEAAFADATDDGLDLDEGLLELLSKQI